MTPLILPGWVDVRDPATVPAHGVSEAYIPFAHETLADVEQAQLHATQHHWGMWLLVLWPWVAGSLAVWTPTKQAQWDRRIDQAPVIVQPWQDAVRIVTEAGQEAARAPERQHSGWDVVRLPSPDGAPGTAPGGESPTVPTPPRSRGFRPPASHRGRALMPDEQARAAWLAEVVAGAKMREWADGLKDDVRWQVVRAVKEGWAAKALAVVLADRWRIAGVNWQRIAVTELSEAYHAGLLNATQWGQQGYVHPIGDAKVCAACKRLLEYKVFRLYPYAPARPTKADWQGALWPGKGFVNVGKPQKEWVPMVGLHPNCRHLLSVIPIRAKGGRADAST